MDQTIIPNGTFVCLRFEPTVEIFLQKLTEQLQTNAEDVFFAQQNPKSGIGSRPFHLKIIGPSRLHGKTCQTVSSILTDISSNFATVRGQVLPICTIDDQGLISLRIKSRDCSLVTRFLSTLLQEKNDTVNHENDTIVTIGSFQGPHSAAFEIWLNNELTRNSSAFPHFQCQFIEVSEECGPLVKSPLRLVGQPASDTTGRLPLKTSGLTEDYPTIGQSSNQSSHGDVAVFHQSKLSLEERLLTSVSTLTQKMRGTGIIRTERCKSDPPTNGTLPTFLRCYIIPVETEKWQNQCLKVFIMLDGMLEAVGPKVKYSIYFIIYATRRLDEAQTVSFSLKPNVSS
jgi:hypothetical protein